jgi:hypothetical protein
MRGGIVMDVQEKIHRWMAFTRACPFLTANPRGLSSLSYDGVELLGYTENLFYGRIFYGPFYVGGASPFYSITVRTDPPRFNEPDITFETDVARLHWQTLETLHRDSLRFFQFLESDTATRIRAMAWPPKSIIDLRMWIGATLYLRDKPLPDWVTKVDEIIASLERRRRTLRQILKGGLRSEQNR